MDILSPLNPWPPFDPGSYPARFGGPPWRRLRSYKAEQITPPETTYLGRYRHGDEITHSSAFGVADSVPMAIVLFGFTYIQSAPVTPAPPSGSEYILRLVPDATRYPIGRFTVTVSYSVGGVAGSQFLSFDVVPGGDSEGCVVSLACVDRPEGSYVLAQTAAGRLMQGNNPRVK